MRPLWQDVLRFAAEWVILIGLGGALGVGTAEAMRAGLVSEWTVLVTFGVLMAGAAAFMIWAAYAAGFQLWDDPYDWDDDSPADAADSLPDD